MSVVGMKEIVNVIMTKWCVRLVKFTVRLDILVCNKTKLKTWHKMLILSGIDYKSYINIISCRGQKAAMILLVAPMI